LYGFFGIENHEQKNGDAHWIEHSFNDGYDHFVRGRGVKKWSES
jgi:hypothetical protein